MQHYIDVCAERHVPCVFEILHMFELLETPSSSSSSSSLTAGGGPLLTLDLSPTTSPFTICERVHNPSYAHSSGEDFGPHSKLLLDATDVACFAEALRRSNDDVSLVLHRTLANILIAGAEESSLTPAHFAFLMTEWRRHLYSREMETSCLESGSYQHHHHHHRKEQQPQQQQQSEPTAIPSLLALRGLRGHQIEVLTTIVAESMCAPVAINIGSDLRRRSPSPFSTELLLSAAVATTASAPSTAGGVDHPPKRLVGPAPRGVAALDLSCNTLPRARTAKASMLRHIESLWMRSNLKHVSLAYCDVNFVDILGSESMQYVVEVFGNLETLSLRGNPESFGSGGGQATAQWLGHIQQKLQPLLLLSPPSAEACGTSSHEVVATHVAAAADHVADGAAAAVVVVDAHPKTPPLSSARRSSPLVWTIRRLDLSRMGLGDEAAAVLSTILRGHKTLEVLVVRRNHFSQVGFSSFAEALIAPGCTIEELYLGNQTPLVGGAGQVASTKQQQQQHALSSSRTFERLDNSGHSSLPIANATGTRLLGIREGATVPSLYNKPTRNATPPTQAGNIPGSLGSDALMASSTSSGVGAANYYSAATTILVALGGNSSVRLCDLTGLPLDDPAMSAIDAASLSPTPLCQSPFIIISALSDLIINSKSLSRLYLSFPSVVQTPMRKELRRNSQFAPPPPSNAPRSSHHHHLTSPSKALFTPRTGNSSSAAPAVSTTGGPLDQFVQPPMRFTSNPSGSSLNAQQQQQQVGQGVLATGNNSGLLHHLSSSSVPIAPLQRFTGPTGSSSSQLSSSSTSLFHLTSGIAFDEFIVAVNTQRELKAMYPITVVDGFRDDEHCTLEALVHQHPIAIPKMPEVPIILPPTQSLPTSHGAAGHHHRPWTAQETLPDVVSTIPTASGGGGGASGSPPAKQAPLQGGSISGATAPPAALSLGDHQTTSGRGGQNVSVSPPQQVAPQPTAAPAAAHHHVQIQGQHASVISSPEPRRYATPPSGSVTARGAQGQGLLQQRRPSPTVYVKNGRLVGERATAVSSGPGSARRRVASASGHTGTTSQTIAARRAGHTEEEVQASRRPTGPVAPLPYPSYPTEVQNHLAKMLSHVELTVEEILSISEEKAALYSAAFQEHLETEHHAVLSRMANQRVVTEDQHQLLHKELIGVRDAYTSMLKAKDQEIVELIASAESLKEELEIARVERDVGKERIELLKEDHQHQVSHLQDCLVGLKEQHAMEIALERNTAMVLREEYDKELEMQRVVISRLKDVVVHPAHHHNHTTHDPYQQQLVDDIVSPIVVVAPSTTAASPLNDNSHHHHNATTDRSGEAGAGGFVSQAQHPNDPAHKFSLFVALQTQQDVPNDRSKIDATPISDHRTPSLEEPIDGDVSMTSDVTYNNNNLTVGSTTRGGAPASGDEQSSASHVSPPPPHPLPVLDSHTDGPLMPPPPPPPPPPPGDSSATTTTRSSANISPQDHHHSVSPMKRLDTTALVEPKSTDMSHATEKRRQDHPPTSPSELPLLQPPQRQPHPVNGSSSSSPASEQQQPPHGTSLASEIDQLLERQDESSTALDTLAKPILFSSHRAITANTSSSLHPHALEPIGKSDPPSRAGVGAAASSAAALRAGSRGTSMPSTTEEGEETTVDKETKTALPVASSTHEDSSSAPTGLTAVVEPAARVESMKTPPPKIAALQLRRRPDPPVVPAVKSRVIKNSKDIASSPTSQKPLTANGSPFRPTSTNVTAKSSSPKRPSAATQAQSPFPDPFKQPPSRSNSSSQQRVQPLRASQAVVTSPATTVSAAVTSPSTKSTGKSAAGPPVVQRRPSSFGGPVPATAAPVPIPTPASFSTPQRGSATSSEAVKHQSSPPASTRATVAAAPPSMVTLDPAAPVHDHRPSTHVKETTRHSASPPPPSATVGVFIDDCPTESVQFEMEEIGLQHSDDDTGSVDFEIDGDYAVAHDVDKAAATTAVVGEANEPEPKPQPRSAGEHRGSGGDVVIEQVAPLRGLMDVEGAEHVLSGSRNDEVTGDELASTADVLSGTRDLSIRFDVMTNDRRSRSCDSVASSLEFEMMSSEPNPAPPGSSLVRLSSNHGRVSHSPGGSARGSPGPSLRGRSGSMHNPPAFVEGSIINSPAAKKVASSKQKKIPTLKEEEVNELREFVVYKILPLTVSELRETYPRVSEMLNGMTMEEYGAFVTSWGVRYRPGQAKRLDELEELMLCCAVSNMFDEVASRR